jgi:hypothetical protein
MKKLAAWIVALAAAVGLAIYLPRAYSDTHPTFDVQWAETVTYRVPFPKEWPKIPLETSSYLFVRNHDPGVYPKNELDWPRMSLAIHDEGPKHASVDEIINAWLKSAQDGKASEIASVQIPRATDAKTFTFWDYRGELSVLTRVIVFKGTNGCFYTASYELPYRWRMRKRYENYFQKILSGVEFKVVPE